MLDNFKPSPTDTKLKNVSPPETSAEPAFMPPEDVAAGEGNSVSEQSTNKPVDTPMAKKTSKLARFKSFLERYRPKTRKQWIISGAAGVVVVGLLVTAWFVFFHHSAKPVVQAVVTKPAPPPPPPKPTTVPSRLTGVMVSPDLNKLPVTGVMIENSPDARPQSGLKDAGIVFEAVAEGGITRFLALYEESQPDYMGPIRSARPYYLQWLLPFDAALAHVGGSPDALASIKTLGVKDLDEFFNGGSYQRITQRFAPHNVYTSMSNLLQLETSKGYTSSTFTGFARKADAPSASPTAKTIDFTISGPLYSVHYDYDAPSNSYKRSEGGLPHTDERSGAQIEPKVVVALVMQQSLASDGYHTIYNTTGSGQMYVFQDGNVQTGTWQKSDAKSQFVFTDQNGQPITLNAGQTWISVVGLSGDVSYKP